MTTVSVATLKSKLSHYLKVAAEGEEVVVTSHSHPVARLGPYKKDDDYSVIVPTLPVEHIKKIKGIKPRKPCDPVAVLIEDRRRRW